MKEYTLSLPLMEYLRKSFDVGSEGRISFCNSFIQQRFLSKSNGTAKASVNGNGIANKKF
jgi:hypothetical protein